MMKKRIVAGLLALSLTLIPVGANATTYPMSYRGKGSCSKSFKTASGRVTGNVTYTKGILKDTVKCSATTSGSIGVTATCCYHETVYKKKVLVDSDSLKDSDATKKIASYYCYGKLSLSGDTRNILYADE